MDAQSAYLSVDQGDDAAEGLVGLAAGQEDVERQDCAGLSRQHCVLGTDREHTGAAIDHLCARILWIANYVKLNCQAIMLGTGDGITRPLNSNLIWTPQNNLCYLTRCK